MLCIGALETASDEAVPKDGETLVKIIFNSCCMLCSYGNNAVEMETTATWNQDAQSFIIDTPSTLAQKYWITNSALHAKWSVVFAQLLMNGKREGVHAFLVRIRHDDMRAVEGVRIEDMGHKMGCNGAHATSGELRHSSPMLPTPCKCGSSWIHEFTGPNVRTPQYNSPDEVDIQLAAACIGCVRARRAA